jgi:hypothetical protein
MDRALRGASIAATFAVLYATQRRALASDTVATDVRIGRLSNAAASQRSASPQPPSPS